MKIKLKEKTEHIELIKAMGSRDNEASRDAMRVFASLVGPLAKKVLDETNVIDGFYDTLSVGEYEPRTIPLDDYHNISEADYVRVSFSSRPGDLAYNQLTGADDVAFSTAFISSAIAFYKKYLKAGRISHAENGIRKLINEVRFKMKRQGIQPILDSLANSTTNGGKHLIRSNTAGQLGLDDFNRLQTMAARVLSSGLGDTPAGLENSTRAIDTLVMSPEMVEEIRAIAYQPMNTRAGTETTSGATAVSAPESVREAVYAAGGLPSIYGTEIIQLNEMGLGQDFNTIFDTLAGNTEFPNIGEKFDSAATSVFTGGSEQFVLGISRQIDVNGLLKVEIADGETGANFNVSPDDQFVAREGKTGMFGEAEVGYLAVEPRNLFGLIV
tara:strand:- start:11103 stop:12254 length:1152 start_codon:yes stop_codon:yes gene_type:complete